MRMCYVRVTYVWRMKCTRDVSTAYVLRSILICGVSVLYQLLFSSPEPKAHRGAYSIPMLRRPSSSVVVRRPSSVVHNFKDLLL